MFRLEVIKPNPCVYREQLLFTDGGRIGDILTGNKRRNPAPTVFTSFTFRNVYCKLRFCGRSDFPEKNRLNNKRSKVFLSLFDSTKTVFTERCCRFLTRIHAEKIGFHQIRIFKPSRIIKGGSTVVPRSRSATIKYRSFVAGKERQKQPCRTIVN